MIRVTWLAVHRFCGPALNPAIRYFMRLPLK